MKIFRVLLFPFAILFDLITRFRNHLYNIKFKPSVSFDLPTLVIGNLIAGGSGKTPHVQYVASKLIGKGLYGILSRGYGRKSKGYIEVETTYDAKIVGDEPLQYKVRFKEDVLVAVGEERILALPEMISSGVKGVVLDDAFQHRKLNASAYVLLTEYDRPFYKDYVLPSGMLREARSGAKRADFIIVTKCPNGPINVEQVKKEISKYNSSVPIAFSTYDYGSFCSVYGGLKDEIIAFSGIAKSELFENYLKSNYNVLGEKRFNDHHVYSTNEIENLVNEAKSLNATLITTEKDYMRILNNSELEKLLAQVSFGYIPIQVRFVEGGEKFDNFVEKVFNV